MSKLPKKIQEIIDRQEEADIETTKLHEEMEKFGLSLKKTFDKIIDLIRSMRT